jgi:hypothetical protein
MALQHRFVVLATLLAFLFVSMSVSLLVSVPAGAVPWRASEEATPATWNEEQPWSGKESPSVVLAARDRVDLESHGGYTSEYIFGMTKGVMRSTLTPALKPVALLFTVPLDLVFLPFAAVGGFFR